LTHTARAALPLLLAGIGWKPKKGQRGAETV
jgi:hypothetical protein